LQQEAQVCVGVRDSKGTPVVGLHERDFRITGGSKGIAITRLTRAWSAPLTVGLMLQWSGLRSREMPYAELRPSQLFLRAILKNGDAGFVMLFAQEMLTRSRVTDSAAYLSRYLEQARGLPLWGPSALYDWMAEESRVEKDAGKQGCRALVIVADGHDNASRRSMQKAVQACLRARTIVYFISLAAVDWSVGVGGRTNLAEDATWIAHQTGGAALFVHKKADFTDAYAWVARDLTDRYLLRFDQETRGRKSQFRHLKLTVGHSGLRVEAPAGYFTRAGTQAAANRNGKG
jgi:VWFA-related protein